MSKLNFTSNAYPTLGVELEVGLVDANTMALTSAIGRVLERLPEQYRDSVKPELMQCYLEVNSGVCRTVAEAEADLREKLIAVERITDALGLRLWWAGTHPFSYWQEQAVTPSERYHQLLGLLQEMGRRLVTFGLHVHVGVDSGDKAVLVCNRIMEHLPTLLAISSNSPFWQNRDTGLHSSRSKIMEALPTAGLPHQMRNWSEYAWLISHLIQTGFINTIREIWWDVRPHNNFGTVEIRMCDMPGSLGEALQIVALIQCLVKRISEEIDEGVYLQDAHPMMVRQNKWRAARYGRAARLVDSKTYQAVPLEDLVGQLIEWLTPTAMELGCAGYLRGVADLAAGPTGSERQLAIFAETGDPAEIVRRLSAASRITA